PPGLPQEPRRYDPLSARLQPLVLAKMGRSTSLRSPESPSIRLRSRKFLLLCHRRRCAPNRGERVHEAAKLRNYDASTARSYSTRSVLLQRYYLQGERETRPNREPKLTLAYRSAPWLEKSLLLWSLRTR